MFNWKQIDATTWQRKALCQDGYSWQISFGEFSQVYSVCLFNDDEAIGQAAFDELEQAKSYCRSAELTHQISG